MNPEREREQADHDLLIGLHEQMKGLRSDLKELGNGTIKRLDELENTRVTKETFNSTAARLEALDEKILKRLEWLERIAYGAIGAFMLLEAYFRFFK